jgi:class 3 adenylate cyclase
MIDRPETRYTKTVDGVNIAYQVLDGGPVDLVYLQPWFSHIEVGWEEPMEAGFLQSLSAFSRLILFDRRGSGLSDPMPLDQPPMLEARMDDVRAVMDAAGSERAVVYGASESGAMAALFAATYPDRTIALVIQGSFARTAWALDYPAGLSPEWHAGEIARIRRSWGTEAFMRELFPEFADSPDTIRWLAKVSRMAMSPGAAEAYEELLWQIDVRDALPSIHVPTLILNSEGDMPEASRYLVEHIPGAEHVEIPGDEHLPYKDQDRITREIERFVRGVRDEEAELDRVLATVLFTDIVDSTATAAEMGDARWRELIDQHDRLAKGMVARYRGQYRKSTGDGLMATFDGPARAVRCAQALVEGMKPLGVEIRAGAHTGEVTLGDNDLAGIGVHVAARVAALAGTSEVWASSTVKDLTVGSGLVFEDAGEHELKGVPDSWHLYRVVN